MIVVAAAFADGGHDAVTTDKEGTMTHDEFMDLDPQAAADKLNALMAEGKTQDEAAAEFELTKAPEFDHIVLNDRLEEAVERTCAILDAFIGEAE